MNGAKQCAKHVGGQSQDFLRDHVVAIAGTWALLKISGGIARDVNEINRSRRPHVRTYSLPTYCGGRMCGGVR